MNHPFSEADIIRYLRRNMDEAEVQSFEKEMDSNKDLELEVSDLKITIQAIDKEGELFMKQRFKKLEQSTKIKRWVSIALIISTLLIIGLILKNVFAPNKNDIPRNIYAKHFEKYRAPVVLRNPESLQKDLSIAIEAYRNNRFEESFQIFNLACSTTNREACFYACLSAIYSEAIPPQDSKNIVSQNDAYMSIILWNEALFNIKNGDTNRAIVLLNDLIKKGNYKTNESKVIVEKLK